VRKNDAEAVKWYRLAAKQSNVAGQSNLGVMYYTGQR
jgi:TPR repeat protein